MGDNETKGAAVPALVPWDTEMAGATTHIYKRAGDVELRLFLFAPDGRPASDRLPAIVFFFGGGWVNGSPNQFVPHCRHLASRGVIGVTAQYRVKNRHGTTPFECVADGRSAVRWLRSHAAELGIDPDRLAAGGGSAGGHVALSTATLDSVNEPGEDLSVSAMPSALALFNPVADTSDAGWGGGKKHLGERRMELSPLHHLPEHMPPTVVFHGDADTTVPLENVERLRDTMRSRDEQCELVIYEGRAHGFFNFGRGDGKDYEDTLTHLDRFFESLGWMA